ncbi:tripartite tricarboxylate transporter permease [Chloroflexota bacterium]
MEYWSGLGEGLVHLCAWAVTAGLIGGTLVGIIIGAIPGIGATVGMAIFLPLIFYWPPEVGLVMLSALWMANNYGSSLSSILLGIPGDAGAIMTIEDGYPMAQQGRAGSAIGVSLMASAIGGIAGALCFLAFAPPIAHIALLFGSSETFWLALLGMTVISTASGSDLTKKLVSAGLGILAGFTGIDTITGYERFTFGTVYLMDRVNLVLVLLGIFAVARLLSAASQRSQVASLRQASDSIFGGMKLALRYPFTLLRSSFIGAILGAIPGLGHTVATVVAYQQTVGSSSHPDTFGKGDPEGVAGPEATNNAVQGAALIPTFTLGIPGSASATLFLAGLAMYGVRLGPRMFTENGALVWTVWWSMLGAIACFLLLGLLLNRFFLRVTVTPFKLLIPVVMVFVVGGAVSCSNSLADLMAVLVFAVFGYIMQRYNYSLVAFVLGFILGPIAEANLFRSLLISGGSAGILFEGWINPILIGLIVLSLASYGRRYLRRGSRPA